MTGAVSLLAERDYGGDLEDNSEVTAIGVAATRILGFDPERVYFQLVNLSANSIYIGFNPQVSATNGIVLSANGGSMVVNAKDDYILTTLEVYALAAGAGSNLYELTMRRASTPKQEGEQDAN